MKMIWCGWKIKENCHVLVNQFHRDLHYETPGCTKIKCVFRDVKWCFNASWGLKGLKHLYISQENKGLYQFEIIINVSISSVGFFWMLIWIFHSWVRGSTLDVGFWRLMSIIGEGGSHTKRLDENGIMRIIRGTAITINCRSGSFSVCFFCEFVIFDFSCLI